VNQTTKNRASIYIDGYNWYHAIFKHKPEWKWLNIQSYFESLRPHEDVRSIKFFSAIVDENRRESEARERHKRYLAAIKTLSKVQVILGKFQDREVTCRADCQKKYNVPEEKKTDVNIAVEIMADTFDNEFDAMIVVSGDSDVQPPIQWVRRRYPEKKIHVYIPVLPHEREKRRLDFYGQIGVECKFLPLDSIIHHQLPVRVSLPDGAGVVRPPTWSSVLPTE
jgi:uncharacterized LabA/DUF88 family protein